MSRRSLALLAAALMAFALPSPARAELTTLNTYVTTGANSDRFVNPGDTLSVTAAGDPTLDLEFRFVVQYDNGSSWEQVAASNWDSANSYSFDPANDAGGPFAEGRYRLVSLVREVGNPADFLANYQTFSYIPADQTLCEYLDGKTFTNAAPVGVTLNLGSVSLSEALTMLSAPGVPVSLASSAHGISTVSFSGDASGGTVTVMPVSKDVPFNKNRVQMRVCAFICMDFDTPVNFTTPLTGTYTCNANTLSIDASGAGSPTNLGTLSGLISEAWVHVTGTLNGDTGAGTLTAGDGAVFTLGAPPAAPDEPTAGLEEDSDGGSLGILSLLVLLGLARRRR